MACIVYQVDKRTGIKYAYSSESYWDKDKKQPRSKRAFLGRVDPITGKIIPKKTKSGSPINTSENLELETMAKELQEKDRLITDLRNELHELSNKYESALKVLNQICSISSPFLKE